MHNLVKKSRGDNLFLKNPPRMHNLVKKSRGDNLFKKTRRGYITSLKNREETTSLKKPAEDA